MDVVKFSRVLFEMSVINGEIMFDIIKSKFFLDEIKSVGYHDFIKHNFSYNSDGYNLRLFEAIPFVWESVDLEKVNNLLLEFDSNKNYNGIINLISFFGKYMKLDLLNHYFTFDLSDKNFRNIFLEINDGFLPLIYLLPTQKEFIIDHGMEHLLKEFDIIANRFHKQGLKFLPSPKEYKLLHQSGK